MDACSMARIFLVCLLMAASVKGCPTNSSTCDPMPSVFNNGVIICTDGNEIGSNFTFNCTTPGYYLNPNGTDTSECMVTGQWSKEIPCCAKACPPYAPLELVWVFNRKDDVQTVWNTFGDSFRSLWKVDTQYIKTSRVLYSGIVHPELSLYFDEPHPPSRSTYELRLKHPPTADGLMNTGNALRHVKEHVFGSKHIHNRTFPVVDVVVVVTDKNSDDDVTTAAENLRSSGVRTYAVFLDYDNTTEVNTQQLIDIGGKLDNVIVVGDNSKKTGHEKAEKLVSLLCQGVCGP